MQVHETILYILQDQDCNNHGTRISYRTEQRVRAHYLLRPVVFLRCVGARWRLRCRCPSGRRLSSITRPGSVSARSNGHVVPVVGILPGRRCRLGVVGTGRRCTGIAGIGRIDWPRARRIIRACRIWRILIWWCTWSRAGILIVTCLAAVTLALRSRRICRRIGRVWTWEGASP